MECQCGGLCGLVLLTLSKKLRKPFLGEIGFSMVGRSNGGSVATGQHADETRNRFLMVGANRSFSA